METSLNVATFLEALSFKCTIIKFQYEFTYPSPKKNININLRSQKNNPYEYLYFIESWYKSSVIQKKIIELKKSNVLIKNIGILIDKDILITNNGLAFKTNQFNIFGLDLCFDMKHPIVFPTYLNLSSNGLVKFNGVSSVGVINEVGKYQYAKVSVDLPF